MKKRVFHSPWEPIPPSMQTWRSGAPIVLEIGAGAGMHAIQLAKKHPNHQIVAIERTTEKFQKLARRADNHHLDNLVTVHADAVQFIAQNIQPGEVDAIYILYPNPYPKAAQANKRFHNMPFWSELLSKLKPAGTLTMASNEPWLIEEAAGQLGLPTQAIIPVSLPPRTHFEKKYLERGQLCVQVEYTRN